MEEVWQAEGGQAGAGHTGHSGSEPWMSAPPAELLDSHPPSRTGGCPDDLHAKDTYGHVGFAVYQVQT